MFVRDVQECSFPSWYPTFMSCTLESSVISLSTEFLQYLKSDGTLVLPSSGTNSDGEDSFDEESYDFPEVQEPDFSDLTAAIRNEISKFPQGVFPKLNWSSPKDSSWISLNRSLKCQDPSEVYLLLKSSEFVCHDLIEPFKDCVDKEKAPEINYSLILRKWVDIHPATEFRCFVKNKNLFAISQRQTECYFPYIHQDCSKITTQVSDFFQTHLKDHFQLDNYTFDVVLTDDTILIDFNPWGRVTDSLLFDWDELDSTAICPHINYYNCCCKPEVDSFDGIIFRTIPSNNKVTGSQFSQYSVPADLMSLQLGNTSLIDYMERQRLIEISSDEECEK